MEVKPALTKSFENMKPPEKMKDVDVKTVVEAVQDQIKEKQTLSEEKKLKEISKEDLEMNIAGVNHFLEVNFTSLKFQVHEDLDRLFVEVIDRETKEVVREIPPKEFLDMISSMLEYVGLFVDKRV